MQKYAFIIVSLMWSFSANATNSIGMVECVKSGDICHSSPSSSTDDNRLIFSKPLTIYAAPNEKKEVAGHIHSEDIMGQLVYDSVDVEQDFEIIKLVEVGYEHYALPVYEVSHNKKWLKIETGWIWSDDVKLGSQTTYVSWLDKLTSQMNNYAFSLNRNALVRALPDDSAPTTETIDKNDGWDVGHDGDGKYNLYDATAIKGNWARVKFYKYCGGEDEPPHAVGWIKLTNEKGLPNLSAYTRGC